MKVTQIDPKDPLSKLILETDPNEDVADLAQAIVLVADAAERLLNSHLTRRAIKVLLKDLTGSAVTLNQIETVLDALPRLKGYLKP